ncbi:MAG: hypothetical protein GWN71_10045, partial [Gammaproteobacteria bacterium]|nr:hypothetical protein [Gemmatimonadota bacterium]NIU73905.1 hypothetical protein [Gammaproteobacteria bacterium]NIX20543.1 hypothetical protein [Actinomycetota bacterium]
SGWQFRNNWNIGFWSSRAFEGVSTGTLRGGPSITRPGAWRGNVWAETDRRKPVSVNVYGFASIEDESGTTQRNGGAFLMIRP